MNKKILQIGFILLVMNAPQLMAGQLNVIVNKNAGVQSLTADEIRQIYLAKRNNFPNGKSVIPIDGKEEGKVFDHFYSRVVRKSGSQLTSYWSRLLFTGKGTPPQQVESKDEVVKMVESDVRRIAYVEGNVTSDNVKVVFTVDVP